MAALTASKRKTGVMGDLRYVIAKLDAIALNDTYNTGIARLLDGSVHLTAASGATPGFTVSGGIITFTAAGTNVNVMAFGY